jgi:hypothetical protein
VLRQHNRFFSAIWGRNDPFFPLAGIGQSGAISRTRELVLRRHLRGNKYQLTDAVRDGAFT